MSTFLKQYGERRTGTNYLRYLLQANYADTVVLMHILGDKHSPPQPFDDLWQATRDTPEPDVAFVERATRAVSRNSGDRERADVRRIAAEVAEAWQRGAIGTLISIKDPYAWVLSMARYEQWRPLGPLQDEERLVTACRTFNEKYAAWLQWARTNPSSIIRYEDLLARPEQTAVGIAVRFSLRRTSPAFVNTTARMARQIIDADAIETLREPFDPRWYINRAYLRSVPGVMREIVTKTIAWNQLGPLGYEPLPATVVAAKRMTARPAVLPQLASGRAEPRRTIDEYRNRHAGETIVVCGCGTSLSSLDRPGRFTTIGVNDVGRLFQPDYLVVLNPRQQFRGERFTHVAESKAKALFTHLELGVDHPNIVYFRLGQRNGADIGPGIALPYTRNSPYVAI